MQDPLQVIKSVLCSGHQAVAQEIVHPIAIKLRRDKLRDERRRVGVLIQRGELFRKLPVEVAEDLADFSRGVQNYPPRPVFVVEVKHLLHNVRERPMPEVVEQGASAPYHARLVAYRVMRYGVRI